MVDTKRVGALTWICTEVTLGRHRATDFELFENAVRQAREVVECDAVGGSIDYVLKVVARDIAHYQEIIDRLLAMDVGIKRYFTYIVTKRIKETAAVPISLLAGDASA